MSKYYVQVIEACVAPRLVGPFKTAKVRDIAAKGLRDFPVFKLDISDKGVPTVGTYTSKFLDGNKVNEYHVQWEIDLSAQTPRQAAEKAACIQRESDGVFDVTDEKGETTRVDLAEEETMPESKFEEIKTVKALDRAIENATEEDVRTCLKRIAYEAFEDDGELNRDKELGADFIGEVVRLLMFHGFAPKED